MKNSVTQKRNIFSFSNIFISDIDIFKSFPTKIDISYTTR